MRIKNLYNTIRYSIFQQVIIVISGFILPRYLIAEYGSEIFGLVNSIKQFLAYFSIVGVGIGISARVALYKPLANNNVQKINEILSATSLFFKKSGYIFLLLLTILIISYPLAIKSQLSMVEEAILIFILGSGTLIEYMVLNKYRVLLTADQKLYVEANIQAQGTLLTLVLSILLIKLHCSIVFVQLVVTFVYLVRTFRLVNYVKINYPTISFKKKSNMNILSNRWSAFFYQLSNIIINSTPIVLLTLLEDLNKVSIYSIYNMIYASLAMIINVFSTGISSTFGNIISSEKSEKLEKDYFIFEFLYYVVSFAIYGTSSKLILPFIKIYTNAITDLNYIQPFLALLFLLNGINSSLRVPIVALIEAAGKFEKNVKLNLLEAFFNIFLSFFFTKYLGIIGVLLGALITSIVRNIFYMIFLKRNIINLNLKEKFIHILVNCLGIIIIYKFPININSISFIHWGANAIIIFIFSIVIVLLLNAILRPLIFRDLIRKIRIFLVTGK